jgi:hypothetical protein
VFRDEECPFSLVGREDMVSRCVAVISFSKHWIETHGESGLYIALRQGMSHYGSVDPRCGS